MLLKLKVLRLWGIKVILVLRVVHLKLLKLFVLLKLVGVKGDDVRVDHVESWCF